MDDGNNIVISAATGLFMAALAALGMSQHIRRLDGRINKVEKDVMFKDTFEEFRKAHDGHIREIKDILREMRDRLP